MAARPSGAIDYALMEMIESLSFQKQHHRTAHRFLVSENQSAYISIAERHRFENPGTTTLDLLEVLTGRYLDIVCLENTYRRSGL